MTLIDPLGDSQVISLFIGLVDELPNLAHYSAESEDSKQYQDHSIIRYQVF